MRRVVVLVLVLVCAFVPAAAYACPKGRPCNKYKTKTIEVPPLWYMRDAKSALPKFDRAVVGRFLKISLWSPVFQAKGAPGTKPAAAPGSKNRVTYKQDTRKLRFVDPENMPKPRDNVRNVFASRIERRQSTMLIELDGVPYAVSACPDVKGYACLLRSEISLDEEPAPPPPPEDLTPG